MADDIGGADPNLAKTIAQSWKGVSGFYTGFFVRGEKVQRAVTYSN